MFALTPAGRYVAILSAVVGTVVQSLITASVMELIRLNVRENQTYDICERINAKEKMKALMVRYFTQSAKVTILKNDYNTAKLKNLSKQEESKKRYVDAVKDKLTMKKLLKGELQLIVKIASFVIDSKSRLISKISSRELLA